MSQTTLVDTLADAANDAMSSARSAVTDTASLVQGKAARLTKRTTKYVKNVDAREMVSDAVGLVKTNPGKALVVALVLGFVAGQMFKRD